MMTSNFKSPFDRDNPSQETLKKLQAAMLEDLNEYPDEPFAVKLERAWDKIGVDAIMESEDQAALALLARRLEEHES